MNKKYHISFTHKENDQVKQDSMTTGASSAENAVKQVYATVNVISIDKIEEV